MIKQLEIKGKDIEAKGNFAFARKAKEFDDKDEDGNKREGLTKIYNGLLSRKTDSIIDFWECAAAKDKSIKREHIENAVEAIIEEEEDTLPLLQGALDVLDNSGFFKQEIKNFWLNVQQGHKATDAENKEKMKASAEILKGMHSAIMNGEEEPEEVTA
ncbi:tail assembly chaperone [Jeotgalicoccus huakuii]|nr:tail assembly chaperone [Jeotgalicoccus huakuii]